MACLFAHLGFLSLSFFPMFFFLFVRFGVQVIHEGEHFGFVGDVFLFPLSLPFNPLLSHTHFVWVVAFNGNNHWILL